MLELLEEVATALAEPELIGPAAAEGWLEEGIGTAAVPGALEPALFCAKAPLTASGETSRADAKIA
jgi:hypothetical protein